MFDMLLDTIWSPTNNNNFARHYMTKPLLGPFETSKKPTLSEEARDKITALIKSSPVVVFMKGTPQAPQCGFSNAVLQMLQACGVSDCVAVDVLDGTSIREDIKTYSEWSTIPQLYINEEFIGGYDIVLEMFRDGSLQSMLKPEKTDDDV
ncbi:glutaredoxin-related protein [Cardiosporidium cionae]|uniref:Glutaredoxin-related protein n=1 Tax=Cardiosporidium cionae TaxID=476202 RepID=A0ABQ7JEL3_9APIC|nr:glutaredoxin-related protein [Cardiosporidium cionae]|eukprot:KAF8822447.1 glutaredoxin-related protein [Cardiosporidium cionae]